MRGQMYITHTLYYTHIDCILQKQMFWISCTFFVRQPWSANRTFSLGNCTLPLNANEASYLISICSYLMAYGLLEICTAHVLYILRLINNYVLSFKYTDFPLSCFKLKCSHLSISISVELVETEELKDRINSWLEWNEAVCSMTGSKDSPGKLRGR